jgi:hypothetical protein
MANDTEVATYSNDPENEPIDAFRLRVGDTDCRDAYLTDAEIKYLIGVEPSAIRAAARGAAAIAAKVAKYIDFRHGPVSKTASQLFEHFNALARDLHREATTDGTTFEVLGRTVAEKEAADGDSSAVQPDFKKGLMDNPRSGAMSETDPTESS